MNQELPEFVPGFGNVKSFQHNCGKCQCERAGAYVQHKQIKQNKLLTSLEDVFQTVPITDGMTLSFHHHFRNGDRLVNQVLNIAAKRGVKNLTVALSSIFPVHEPLVGHIRSGVIRRIDTCYMSGPVADAVSTGALEEPVILRSHGGRARALERGELTVDVAFIAASCADVRGNCNGTEGPAACGSLGYALMDAAYARHVVVVTDTIMPYPVKNVSIPESQVEYVVQVEEIGDPAGICSGTTQITRDPLQLKIARLASEVIRHSGLFKDGFSFQAGAGGISLAVTDRLHAMFRKENVHGSFILGGITGLVVRMLEEGVIDAVLDVQDFDLDAVRSLKDNAAHREISSSLYANPFTFGAVVNNLDCVVLGATEIDTDFNVNVVTSTQGSIMGGSGGHSDAAAGARLTMITANLIRGRMPLIRDKICTVSTPGETVDVLVTEYGIAVNRDREELELCLKKAGLPVFSIQELKAKAEKITGIPRPLAKEGRIVALVEYRDGSVIDVVRQVSAN